MLTILKICIVTLNLFLGLFYKEKIKYTYDKIYEKGIKPPDIPIAKSNTGAVSFAEKIDYFYILIEIKK